MTNAEIRAELMKRLDAGFGELQKLNIQPTRDNVIILANTLTILQDVYAYLTDQAKAEEDENVI